MTDGARREGYCGTSREELEVARALVIGGTLFIGRALVERLLERGDEVAIMHRREGTPFGDRVEEILCDRNDAPAVRKALAGETFDVVYDNVYDWERGTTADPVVAAARAAAEGGGLRRYVFTSSVAVYGGGPDHGEGEELAPPDHPEPYVRNKAETERALFRLHREEGIPVSTLRPPFIYGPGNPFDREAFFWDRILADRPVLIPGDGTRHMQWVHVEDVVRALTRAAEMDAAEGKAYNLGNHPPVTQVEFVEAMARAAGRPVQLAFVPREKIEAAGGDLFAPPLYFGAYLDVPPITVRVDRVREELGLDPIALDDGLRDTFAWYRQQPRPTPDFSWEDRLIEEASG
jgi:2'-hydroxyisoflavone reductase